MVAGFFMLLIILLLTGQSPRCFHHINGSGSTNLSTEILPVNSRIAARDHVSAEGRLMRRANRRRQRPVAFLGAASLMPPSGLHAHPPKRRFSRENNRSRQDMAQFFP